MTSRSCIYNSWSEIGHVPQKTNEFASLALAGGYPEFICCNISKVFCLQWKAIDLPYKMGYILCVVALLEDRDVPNMVANLDFIKN